MAVCGSTIPAPGLDLFVDGGMGAIVERRGEPNGLRIRALRHSIWRRLEVSLCAAASYLT